MIAASTAFVLWSAVQSPAPGGVEITASCELEYSAAAGSGDALDPAPGGAQPAVKVVYRWTARNAARVLVDGADASSVTSGQFTDPGGVHRFVAIGRDGRAMIRPLVCFPQPNVVQSRYGLRFHVDSQVLPDLIRNGLKQTITRDPDLARVKHVATELLQSRNYTVAEEGAYRDEWVILYTPEYRPDGDISDAKVERQVAYTIFVKRWLTERGQFDRIELVVVPAVVSRYRMEGGGYTADPNEAEVGGPRAKLIADALGAALAR